MKIMLPALCLGLAIAAGGRFSAEADVRQARAELAALERAGAEEEAEADRLRLEVEVLESAQRFEEVNAATLRLTTPSPEQLSTKDAFAARIGQQAVPTSAPVTSDVIGNAITMSDPETVTAPEGDRP